MAEFKSLCVFCGATTRCDPSYLKQAFAIGALLADNGITLVYGGAVIGLMGAVADGSLSRGGQVIGVIPEHLQSVEKGHEKLTKLYVVKNMHERKQKMFDLSEGIIVLPGGFGTLDEICEILTWKQLALHAKPIVFFNSNGYWDHFRRMLESMKEERFIRDEHLDFLEYVDKEEHILDALSANRSHYHLKFVGHSDVLVDVK